MAISGYDKKVLEVMSEILVKICEPGVEVTDAGFKSFMRFYEKIMLLSESLAKETI